MEYFVIGLFCALLVGCIGLDISILVALVLGFVLFFAYGLIKHFTARELLKMALSGIKTIGGILVIFLLVGMLTALWRACGTIPAIICLSASLIRPAVFFLAVFLLNCAISVMTGTSFGTAATIGVISMSIASAMDASPIITGGAVLSGIFFGDRCSPVSTSAHLVCELTGTDIFANIRRMCRSALIPFLLACILYGVLGLTAPSTAEIPDVQALFGASFDLSWPVLLPAIIILVLSLLHVSVRIAMSASILAAALLALFVQHIPLGQVMTLLVVGYQSADPAIAPMLDGGGLQSMVRVAAIVCLSSTYSGLFQGTGLLEPLKNGIVRLSRRITPFGAVTVTALASGMVACNQTLSIMLTNQLCSGLGLSPEDMALDLEDTAVIIAPLVPWSIAGAVPIATIGAPTACLTAAFFLYLLPVCSWIREAALVRVVKRKN
jgi:NhaC family Na+:H+ antiporter